MLEAAENEDADAEEQGQIFAQFVRVVGESIDGYEDQEVTEYAQYEKTQISIVDFCFYERRVHLQSGAFETCSEDECSHEVAYPDQDKGPDEGRLLLQAVAHLAGKQVCSVGAYHKQAYNEEKCSGYLVPGKDECGTAEGNAYSGEDSADKHFKGFQNYVLLMIT